MSTKPPTIYLSFLGIGDYRPVVYQWGEASAPKTPYAPEAELRILLQTGRVDRERLKVLIFGTEQSWKMHWEQQKRWNATEGRREVVSQRGLRARLESLEVSVERVTISGELAASEQWEMFQSVLQQVPRGADLIVDITHGFRAVPVVLSSALHFLRLALGVRLRHVLYGAYEPQRQLSHIVDYVDFYAIQDWTDGVSRLVDEADAQRLATLSQGGSELLVRGFDTPELSQALLSITDAVRNVEVHQISARVHDALARVDAALQSAEAQGEAASAILLQLVKEKFGSLATAPPLSGHYDTAYFDVQRAFIDLLLEHRLFMQAFTAMREYVGSLGMAAYKPGKLKFSNADGRKRRNYAELFLRMMSYPRETWNFAPDDPMLKTLTPFYERLDEAGLAAPLRELLNTLSPIRNGFDHAWTSRAHVPDQIATQGRDIQRTLAELTPGVLAVSSPSDASEAVDGVDRHQ